ncbi:L-seryl-tRNA(Sec) selenium transferase [bacterium]|nr:L-seryl-tRNA(Sec) selenium transferase [bacterium]
MSAPQDPRRQLPGVDTVLDDDLLRELSGTIARPFLTVLIRRELQRERDKIEKGRSPADASKIAKRVHDEANRLVGSAPRRVINATGVVLHTGLGRAPLSDSAKQALLEACGYCDLELDLESGKRGDRQSHVEELLCWITGADASLVVNNNAAALYLVLNALAYRKEVIVSRGQLIEIGGSFRLPEIMARSGVKLVEVGTTNRTRIGDYRAAITENSAILLRAYPSNFRVEGFTETVELADLVAVAREAGVLCVDDLGGGLLWDWSQHGLPTEPTVTGSLAAGFDLVLVSGDKVIGGPQSGIVLGNKDLIARLKKSPLARVLRPSKLEIAALAATLQTFLHPERTTSDNLTWKLLSEPLEALRKRASELARLISPVTEWETLETTESASEAGSGTLPAVPLPSMALKFLPKGLRAEAWARALRLAKIPVVGIVQDNCVLLNLRTVPEDELPLLVESIRTALQK